MSLAKQLVPFSNPVRLKLLRFLVRPHRLDEIADHLGITRQAARKHIDRLLAVRALDKRVMNRRGGAATEFVVNRGALFLVQVQFEKLGALPVEEDPKRVHHTMTHDNWMLSGRTVNQPALILVRGMDFGRRYRLHEWDNSDWTVGRGSECEVSLRYDPWVSLRHAEVHKQKGEFMLTDLGSTNGTYHNWSELPQGQEVLLRHGDVVALGGSMLLFWDQE